MWKSNFKRSFAIYSLKIIPLECRRKWQSNDEQFGMKSKYLKKQECNICLCHQNGGKLSPTFISNIP